jgi:putative tricarboxylic transport membrane protein
VEVFNLPGAGGTVGLQRLVDEKGNGKLLMQMGLGLVGAVYSNRSQTSLADTTPVARLIQEPDVVVVPRESPYRSIEDLVSAWRAHPRTVTVGGGSSPGGPDHLATHLIADAVGIEAKQVHYIQYDGGGDLLAGIIGGEVKFGVSGIGEYTEQISSGQLRALAVTSTNRVDGVAAPTLQEAGIGAEFNNWRGIVAPAGLSHAEHKALLDLVEKLRRSEQWTNALQRNGWTDAYLPGDRFGEFLESENRRVGHVLTGTGSA